MYRIDPHTCPMYSFEPPIFPAIWPMYSFDPCFSTKTYDVEFWGTYHLWSMPTQTPPEYPPGACPDSKVHWPTWTLLSGRLLVKCIFIHGKLCPPPPAHTHTPLQWRRNEQDGVSNYQPHDYFLNRLFRRRSKKTSKIRVTGLCDRWIPRT